MYHNGASDWLKPCEVTQDNVSMLGVFVRPDVISCCTMRYCESSQSTSRQQSNPRSTNQSRSAFSHFPNLMNFHSSQRRLAL
jgi:hypothetical protein